MADEIYGYSTEDIKEYVGPDSEEYINRFRNLKTKRKFNFTAAILGGFWFGYRKAWLEGTGIWIFCRVLKHIIRILQLQYFYLLSNTDVDYSYQISICMMYVIQFVIFGFTADKLYWRNIKRRIDFGRLPEDIREKKLGLVTMFKECKGASVWHGIGMLFWIGGMKLLEDLFIL